jgi:predicted ester cyclase
MWASLVTLAYMLSMTGMTWILQRKGDRPMAGPLEIYTAWQRRQAAGDVAHLGEVVDLEGFRDICIGLSDWTTGYEAAFANLTRNILTPFADWQASVEAVVEGQDAVVVRQRASATHVADFLGVAATGRRVTWEVVTMVKVRDGRVIENVTLLDLWGLHQQLTAPDPHP